MIHVLILEYQCEFYYDPEKTIQDGQQPQKKYKKT